ncbi:MAG: hypothetical protein ABIX37_11560 [Gammaproteobacteria bacterium]
MTVGNATMRIRGAALLLAAVLSVALARPADAAPAINVSEICTTCKDVIRCVRDPGSLVPPDYPVVVYYLHEHTFWEQVATIWDYLVRFGKAKEQDTRALTIYEFKVADEPPARVLDQQQAELDAVGMTIAVPGGQIDRHSGAWSIGSPSLQQGGSCQLMPPADGFAFLRANAPDS